MDPLAIAFHYHDLTKHHLHRYARGPGRLDWDTQPNPFRRYQGAPTIPLLLADPPDPPAYDALYEPGAIPTQPVRLESVSAFFQYSLALSAWKEIQTSRWALRINPSSGNLHPTEGYLLIGPVDRLTPTPALFHYAPKDHALERRCDMPTEAWRRLTNGFPPETFFAALSSIHWREAWKYGERAYRYCQHDAGHALAALSLAAALQGWQMQPMDQLSDRDVSSLLGLDRAQDINHAEPEHPDLLIAVFPTQDAQPPGTPTCLPNDAIESVAQSQWHGQANSLSPDHVEWELIDAVADACAKPPTPPLSGSIPAPDFPDPPDPKRPDLSAHRIILQRRSAVAMDGRTPITADRFYLMMDRTLPRFARPPWTAIGPPAFVHLALFVHRVIGLDPGLYFLLRSPTQASRLRDAMNPEFDWVKPIGCPPSLPLYHLKTADARAVAAQVSCGQDIAADGAFSLGMIADFEEPLQTHGPWIYRRLFWETGIIGQVLYLEAEAAGVRSTGIGCFFDNPVHGLFGFHDRKFQSLYHFTVGGPVEDTRLTTLPPYPLKIVSRQPPQTDSPNI
jgi:SagB-type dehydrogenase family enzyme